VKHLIPEFEALKKRLPPGLDSTLVLPCLRRIQDDRGYVADEDIDALVEYLGVPRIQIEEVLTFYTMLRRKPIGRWHLQVCRNVSCSMRGAERMIDHLSRRLGVAPGQTTADGRFTLSTVECLGSCGTAPVVMVNERYHELQDERSLDTLLEELKQS
jgi:NADH-quinone oxidoreductase subunit E